MELIDRVEEDVTQVDDDLLGKAAMARTIEIMDEYATAALTGIVMRENVSLLPDAIAQQTFKITKACIVERSAMIQWIRLAFDVDTPDV
jgi:uncharacterized protein YbcI